MDPEILEQLTPVVPEKDLAEKLKESCNTIKRLVGDGKIKDAFIINLSKSNIVLKLQYDQKITTEELDFLKKNCTEK